MQAICSCKSVFSLQHRLTFDLIPLGSIPGFRAPSLRWRSWDVGMGIGKRPSQCSNEGTKHVEETKGDEILDTRCEPCESAYPCRLLGFITPWPYRVNTMCILFIQRLPCQFEPCQFEPCQCEPVLVNPRSRAKYLVEFTLIVIFSLP